MAWWKYDDVVCRQVSQEEVLACPGGYGVLLFYSKMPAAEATSSLATNSSDRAAATTGASEETRGSSNPTQKEAAETGMGEAEVERERNHAKDRASDEARGFWSSDRVGEAKVESGEAEVGQKRDHAKAKAPQEVAGVATLGKVEEDAEAWSGDVEEGKLRSHEDQWRDMFNVTVNKDIGAGEGLWDGLVAGEVE